MNPRKMKQMMKQMGIDVTELDADEVVIRTADQEIVFDAPQVTRMDAQGQETYQIVGEPTEHDVDDAAAAVEGDTEAADDEAEQGIPEDDVKTVAQRAEVGRDEAREALEAEDGDLAAAIMRLE